MASYLPDPGSIKFLKDSINHLSLFTTITSNTHDVYLLIHQLIPQDLYDMIYSYTHKHTIIRKIIFEFMSSFLNYFIKETKMTSFMLGNEQETYQEKINESILKNLNLILPTNSPLPQECEPCPCH